MSRVLPAGIERGVAAAVKFWAMSRLSATACAALTLRELFRMRIGETDEKIPWLSAGCLIVNKRHCPIAHPGIVIRFNRQGTRHCLKILAIGRQFTIGIVLADRLPMTVRP